MSNKVKEVGIANEYVISVYDKILPDTQHT